MSVPVLQIKDPYAQYGGSHILHGVNLAANHNEVVTLLGRNGTGRTTTLRAIMGLVGARRGSIIVYDAGDQGAETIDLPTYKIVHCGIGHCPEERGILLSLSCEENLMLLPVPGGRVAKTDNAGASIDEIYEMFPDLAKCRQNQGTRLSGGKQQMLATGHILHTGANLSLLDGISEGSAPVIVQALAHMVPMLEKYDYTAVMVEQNFHLAASLADRFYAMEHGRIVERSEAAQLQDRVSVLHELLGI